MRLFRNIPNYVFGLLIMVIALRNGFYDTDHLSLFLDGMLFYAGLLMAANDLLDKWLGGDN
jgi:hypothetical protein